MPDNQAVVSELDLASCADEPIHIPGSIQPGGMLLVLDPHSLVILQAAGAHAALLGLSAPQLIGTPLATLLTDDDMDRLWAVLRQGDLQRPVHLFDIVAGPGRGLLDASIHRNAGGVLFEAESARTESGPLLNALIQVQSMIAAVSQAASVASFCQAVTAELQAATGYDRVMVYRFLPDDSGAVIAETVVNQADSFLGLRYPASDVPSQARTLYMLNWLRIVSDIDDTPAPLYPTLNPLTRAPLDMSLATLRSVSPIHIEYLRNMGVRATMTISLIKDNRLWGLIACHHPQPRRIPRQLRAVCELFGNMAALQLDARERAEALEYRHRSNGLHAQIVRGMAAESGMAVLTQQAEALLAYIDCDGVMLLVDGQYRALGRTPSEAQGRALALWLDQNLHDGRFATDALGDTYPPGAEFLAEASGVLAISASRLPSDYIMWFRREMVEDVRWAGDPSKPVAPGPHGLRLMPRSSFAEWVQSVRGHARPWTENELSAAALMRTSLLEVVLRQIDALARQREAAQKRHALMVAELNHRVKNTLATIQALARYTQQSASSLTAYVNDFERRIQAMATSHNLLSEASWDQADLRTLITAQLAPYAAGGNLVVEGADVAILSRAASPLGMVFHELATNAAKYGALSNRGRVEVSWRLTGALAARSLIINWVERGGPPVQPPSREGFGTFTINRIIPFQCDGRSSLSFAPEGVECEIELGADTFFGGDGPAVLPPPRETGLKLSAQAMKKPAILVVEDETIIAFLIEKVVTAAGYDVVGPVSRLARALEIIRARPLSAALLDVNLAGEMSWPIARLLRKRGVPFTFMTGYTHTDFLPPEFATVPILGKPFEDNLIRAAIVRMISG